MDISQVYPWFIVVVSYALPVELVELCVYASVAVVLTLKNVFKNWRWIHSTDVLKSCEDSSVPLV